MILYINATTEQLEKTLPFTKGKWKPFIMPVFNKEEILKGGIIDLTKNADKHRWEPALPKL